MHPRPNNVAQGKKSDRDGNSVGLASFEHSLCPFLVERDSGNDGTPLFTRNLGEGLSADLLALVRLEIDSGDSATQTTGRLGHAFFDRTWEDFWHDGLITPTLDPLLVEHLLEILSGILTSQKGKEFVRKLVESHSISEEMGRTNKQIEIVLWLIIFEG